MAYIHATLLTAACIALPIVFWRLWSARRVFHNLHGSLPQVPYHLLLGNLPAVADLFKTTPPDAYFHAFTTVLSRRYSLGSLYYLDLWPAISIRHLVINDPVIAKQVVTNPSLPKHPIIQPLLGSLTGTQGMFTAEGRELKHIRSMFGPAFSNAHLTTLVPTFVDLTLKFCQVLDDASRKQATVKMVNIAGDLTLDMIGHAILAHDFGAQTQPTEFVSAYHAAISWKTNVGKMSPFQHPLQGYYQRKYAAAMNRYLSNVVVARHTEHTTEGDMAGRPAVDLALKHYIQDNSVDQDLDPSFVSFLVDQVKTFVVAGHDTTASALSCVLFLLSKNLEALEKVRSELDTVIGSQDTTARRLKESPTLLNQLVYTTAVIKETLRLYPVAATARLGQGPIKLEDGREYEARNMLVAVNNFAIHRRADLFPCPDEFIPERFLQGEEAFQEIPRDAYRPFEKGPRACFGQEMAMLELRLVLAMTARLYDFRATYTPGAAQMFGHPAYLTTAIGAVPVAGMPMRVEARS